MNRLNGWQRMWVVLTVLWTLLIGAIAYINAPTSVLHIVEYSAKPPYAKMSPLVRNHMTSTPSWEGEDCNAPSPFGKVYEEVKDLPGLKVPVRLCFELKGIREEDRQEIDGIVTRMTAARESEADIKLVVEELKRRAAEKPGALSTKLSYVAVDAIKAEYERVYRAELSGLRQTHYQIMGLFWVIPAVALYGFGWCIGWIWRGFKK